MCNISFKLEPLVFPVISVVGKHKAKTEIKCGQLRESDKIQFTGSDLGSAVRGKSLDRELKK